MAVLWSLPELLRPGWAVVSPWPIAFEIDEDGTTIVFDEEDGLGVWGTGAGLGPALRDYAASLIEYCTLIEAEANDHAPSRALLARIRRFVAKAEPCSS